MEDETYLITKLIRDYISGIDFDFDPDLLNLLNQLFDPRTTQNTLSYLLPVRRLALYLIERIYYLPEIVKLFELRTNLLSSVKDMYPEFLENTTNHVFDTYIDKVTKWYFGKNDNFPSLSKIFSATSLFMHFFLQLANPSRRFADITYFFMFERTSKLETMMKIENRANFVITKVIEGTEYIQLVFDSTHQEQLLSRLPFQFLQPEIAMIFTADRNFPGFDTIDFNPNFLLLIGDQYIPAKSQKSAYFLEYRITNYSYLYTSPSDERLNVSKIKY